MSAFNYFNYFTEIEEYFWRKRGAHLLVSPLDWAIVETWQKAGIPLGAVMKGIDRAFESYERSRRGAGGRRLKSLAYCVDAVLDAAAEAQEACAGSGPEILRARQVQEPFSRTEMARYFEENTKKLRAAAAKVDVDQQPLKMRCEETATRLGELAPLLDASDTLDLEDLERRLTVLEDKLAAALSSAASETGMLEIRRQLDRQLAPYRRKMTPEQIAQLERQYIQKRLFEAFGIPRLSLFYLT